MIEVNFLKDLLGKKFVIYLMKKGKKTKAEKIFLDCLVLLKKQGYKEPLKLIRIAVQNAKPLIQIRSVRVGGSSYQVPIPLTKESQESAGVRSLIKTARDRQGGSMSTKLAFEVINASKKQGESIRRRINLHKIGDANRAYAHYRWF